MQARNIYFVLLLTGLVFGGMMCTQHAKKSVGQFVKSTDVGDCKIPGTMAFDADSGFYHIGGSGQNMWFKEDDFHFV